MKLLTSEQKREFDRDGYVSPIRIMSTEQALTLRPAGLGRLVGRSAAALQQAAAAYSRAAAHDV